MEQVRKEGSRTVKRSLEIYNLDVIISIGYRINSLAGTKFRQWATKTIREHITQGYTLNKKRVAQNLDQFLKAVIFFEKISCQKKTQQNSSQMSELITVFMASLGMYSSLLAEKIFIQPWKKKPSIYFISWWKTTPLQMGTNGQGHLLSSGICKNQVFSIRSILHQRHSPLWHFWLRKAPQMKKTEWLAWFYYCSGSDFPM